MILVKVNIYYYDHSRSHIKEIAQQQNLNLPDNWTEKQIMYSWGYYQIYDCGMMKYVKES